ncbi:MAG: hypothetical protein AAF292_16295 [Pseudomonadota bacterium]
MSDDLLHLSQRADQLLMEKYQGNARAQLSLTAGKTVSRDMIAIAKAERNKVGRRTDG